MYVTPMYVHERDGNFSFLSFLGGFFFLSLCSLLYSPPFSGFFFGFFFFLFPLSLGLISCLSAPLPT